MTTRLATLISGSTTHVGRVIRMQSDFPTMSERFGIANAMGDGMGSAAGISKRAPGYSASLHGSVNA